MSGFLGSTSLFGHVEIAYLNDGVRTATSDRNLDFALGFVYRLCLTRPDGGERPGRSSRHPVDARGSKHQFTYTHMHHLFPELSPLPVWAR